MKAVSGGTATLAIARLSLTRFLRSRVLLVAGVFAFLPLLPFAFGADEDSSPELRWKHYFEAVAYVHMLVASLLMAPVIAEEVEDKTYTYLWSRPIPRWSVLAGKLLTGGLIATAFLGASALAATQVTGLLDIGILAQGMFALTIGVVSVGCISSSLGILLPKHPLAAAITYFLVLDSMIGAMPFAASRISVMHNVIALSGHGRHESSPVTALLWLCGLAVFWTAISLWRLARKELSTGS